MKEKIHLLQIKLKKTSKKFEAKCKKKIPKANSKVNETCSEDNGPGWMSDSSSESNYELESGITLESSSKLKSSVKSESCTKPESSIKEKCSSNVKSTESSKINHKLKTGKSNEIKLHNKSNNGTNGQIEKNGSDFHLNTDQENNIKSNEQFDFESNDLCFSPNNNTLTHTLPILSESTDEIETPNIDNFKTKTYDSSAKLNSLPKSGVDKQKNSGSDILPVLCSDQSPNNTILINTLPILSDTADKICASNIDNMKQESSIKLNSSPELDVDKQADSRFDILPVLFSDRLDDFNGLEKTPTKQEIKGECISELEEISQEVCTAPSNQDKFDSPSDTESITSELLEKIFSEMKEYPNLMSPFTSESQYEINLNNSITCNKTSHEKLGSDITKALNCEPISKTNQNLGVGFDIYKNLGANLNLSDSDSESDEENKSESPNKLTNMNDCKKLTRIMSECDSTYKTSDDYGTNETESTRQTDILPVEIIKINTGVEKCQAGNIDGNCLINSMETSQTKPEEEVIVGIESSLLDADAGLLQLDAPDIDKSQLEVSDAIESKSVINETISEKSQFGLETSQSKTERSLSGLKKLTPESETQKSLINVNNKDKIRAEVKLYSSVFERDKSYSEMDTSNSKIDKIYSEIDKSNSEIDKSNSKRDKSPLKTDTSENLKLELIGELHSSELNKSMNEINPHANRLKLECDIIDLETDSTKTTSPSKDSVKECPINTIHSENYIKNSKIQIVSIISIPAPKLNDINNSVQDIPNSEQKLENCSGRIPLKNIYYITPKETDLKEVDSSPDMAKKLNYSNPDQNKNFHNNNNSTISKDALCSDSMKVINIVDDSFKEIDSSKGNESLESLETNKKILDSKEIDYESCKTIESIETQNLRDTEYTDTSVVDNGNFTVTDSAVKMNDKKTVFLNKSGNDIVNDEENQSDVNSSFGSCSAFSDVCSTFLDESQMVSDLSKSIQISILNGLTKLNECSASTEVPENEINLKSKIEAPYTDKIEKTGETNVNFNQIVKLNEIIEGKDTENKSTLGELNDKEPIAEKSNYNLRESCNELNCSSNNLQDSTGTDFTDNKDNVHNIETNHPEIFVTSSIKVDDSKNKLQATIDEWEITEITQEPPTPALNTAVSIKKAKIKRRNGSPICSLIKELNQREKINNKTYLLQKLIKGVLNTMEVTNKTKEKTQNSKIPSKKANKQSVQNKESKKNPIIEVNKIEGQDFRTKQTETDLKDVEASAIISATKTDNFKIKHEQTKNKNILSERRHTRSMSKQLVNESMTNPSDQIAVNCQPNFIPCKKNKPDGDMMDISLNEVSLESEYDTLYSEHELTISKQQLKKNKELLKQRLADKKRKILDNDSSSSEASVKRRKVSDSFNCKSSASPRKTQNNKCRVKAKSVSSRNVEFKSKEFISTDSEGSTSDDKERLSDQMKLLTCKSVENVQLMPQQTSCTSDCSISSVTVRKILGDSVSVHICESLIDSGCIISDSDPSDAKSIDSVSKGECDTSDNSQKSNILLESDFSSKVSDTVSDKSIKSDKDEGFFSQENSVICNEDVLNIRKDIQINATNQMYQKEGVNIRNVVESEDCKFDDQNESSVYQKDLSVDQKDCREAVVQNQASIQEDRLAVESVSCIPNEQDPFLALLETSSKLKSDQVVKKQIRHKLEELFSGSDLESIKNANGSVSDKCDNVITQRTSRILRSGKINKVENVAKNKVHKKTLVKSQEIDSSNKQTNLELFGSDSDGSTENHTIVNKKIKLELFGSDSDSEINSDTVTDKNKIQRENICTDSDIDSNKIKNGLKNKRNATKNSSVNTDFKNTDKIIIKNGLDSKSTSNIKKRLSIKRNVDSKDGLGIRCSLPNKKLSQPNIKDSEYIPTNIELRKSDVIIRHSDLQTNEIPINTSPVKIRENQSKILQDKTLLESIKKSIRNTRERSTKTKASDRVFKKPNCTRYVPATPQSPPHEPDSDFKLLDKPVIIPLEKQKEMDTGKFISKSSLHKLKK